MKHSQGFPWYGASRASRTVASCALSGLSVLALLSLTACDRTGPATSAPERPAETAESATADLSSPPAVVSAERHTGAFADGDALSFDATLKPLVDATVKTVRLDVTHKLIEIAPGVQFGAWTFGDQVPGPTVHARVGDTIRFTMTNRSDETVAAPGILSAPMMHSMDFHAALVAPQDKYRSIAPGQTVSFEFVARYPGVFMYHCGTPMVLEHIAAGMYGAVIVEPREGYPTKVDREYVVIQSEFYAQLDPDSRKVEGGAPLYVMDGQRLREARPTHTVFNGEHNGMVRAPLKAEPGERVRLYVLNVGPSKSSSFHVVGTIFDRVWFEGNPANEFHGMQTVLLGSSNSAIVEFMIPEAGSYIMVDHHFANASQGAVGLIESVMENAAALEHHNFAASARPSDPEAVKGKQEFESKCLACHAISGGEGVKLGPDMLGVTGRRTGEWLTAWLKAPEKMLATDPVAQAMLKQYNNIPMPNQNLSDAEIAQYLAYFRWIDAQPMPPAPPRAAH